MNLKPFLALFLSASALCAAAQGYRDGVEYYKAGRIERAHELLEKNFDNADTDKAEANYFLGLINLDYYSFDMRRNKTAEAKKELAAATDYFKRGIAANPEYALNYVGLGRVALINNNNKEAEDYFKQAQKHADKDAGVYAAIARAYYSVDPQMRFYKKPYDKALATAEKLMYKRITAPAGKADFRPNDQDYYITLGDIIFDTAGSDKKLVGDACNEYERAIQVDPKDAAAYVKYADTYFQIKHDVAIAKLRELLAQSPESALGQRELAEKLYEDGQVAQATQEYAKLMRNPNHFKDDENRYLELLYFSKDHQTGFNQSATILASDPGQFSARSWNYVFAHELGRTDVVDIAKALLDAQKNSNAKLPYGVYPMIARDFNKAGLADEAISVLRLGLNHYPDNADMLKESASALAALNRFNEAADMLSAYVSKQGSNEVTGTELWTLSQYAVIAAQEAQDPAVQGKYFQMSRESASKAEPKLAAQYKYLVHKRLGDIAQINNQDTEAAAEYLQAIKMMEDTNTVATNAKDAMAMYRFVGIAAYNNHDYNAAKSMLTKFQALNPDDAQINGILSKMK